MDDKKPAKKANSTEFSGRLDSINVSAAGNHFQFELVGKSGSMSYLLDSANPSAFSTLAAFVTSAYMAGKKIHVQATANGEGLPFASSIRIGAKPKIPKAKSVKRVKGPVVEAQPVAA